MLGLLNNLFRKKFIHKNLLYNWRLNIDNNSDGFADRWSDTWAGAGTTATYTIDGGQKIEITACPSAEVALCSYEWDYYIPVLEGETYILKGYTKNTADIRSYVGFNLCDGAKGYVSSQSGSKADNLEYVMTSLEQLIPAGIGYITVNLIAEPDGNDLLGSAWFKNIVLQKVS